MHCCRIKLSDEAGTEVTEEMMHDLISKRLKTGRSAEVVRRFMFSWNRIFPDSKTASLVRVFPASIHNSICGNLLKGSRDLRDEGNFCRPIQRSIYLIIKFTDQQSQDEGNDDKRIIPEPFWQSHFFSTFALASNEM